MNTWGLPDWRDATSYGDTANWTWHRWRWEFYRRREDLRTLFDQFAATSYQTQLRVATGTDIAERVLKPDEPGFTALVPGETGLDYAAIPNPRISDQPEAVLKLIFEDPDVKFYPAEHYRHGISLDSDDQIAVVFTLDRPLPPQLDHALNILRRAQQASQGKLLEQRSHPKKWLRYLRVLDARESGASWSETAQVLPGSVSRTAQAARDNWNQARALCFNF